MMKLDCIIVDDEPHAGQLLADYISRLPQLVLKGNCFDGKEALELIASEHADLLFLDINMPGLTGMELLNMLPKDISIVFTTAYSEYAIESYEYHIVDYLLKPISFNRFMKSVIKAEQLIIQRQQAVQWASQTDLGDDFIFVKSDKKMIRINFGEILFFEAVREYIYIHTAIEKILIYKRMKELMEKLPDRFIRVHNSYIIHAQYIDKVEGNHVVVGQVSIPLGVTYKDRFLEYIQSRAL